MRISDLTAEELGRVERLLGAMEVGDVGAFAAEAVAAFVSNNPSYAPLAPLAVGALVNVLTGRGTLLGRFTGWLSSWF